MTDHTITVTETRAGFQAMCSDCGEIGYPKERQLSAERVGRGHRVEIGVEEAPPPESRWMPGRGGRPVERAADPPKRGKRWAARAIGGKGRVELRPPDTVTRDRPVQPIQPARQSDTDPLSREARAKQQAKMEGQKRVRLVRPDGTTLSENCPLHEAWAMGHPPHLILPV